MSFIKTTRGYVNLDAVTFVDMTNHGDGRCEYQLIGADGKLIDHVDPDEALRRIDNEAFRRTATAKEADRVMAQAREPARPGMPPWAT